MQDRAPSEEVMVYRRIFGHPQVAIPRLTESLRHITRPLSARPNFPPPSPFNGGDGNDNNNNSNNNSNNSNNNNNQNGNNNKNESKKSVSELKPHLGT